LKAGLPEPVEDWLNRMGFGNIQAIQERASAVLSSGLRIAATQAVSVGQGAFNFFISLSIMLYLTFFLLRDGRELNRKIGQHIPLRPETRRALFEKFATVIRATIKGSIVVALVQGLIGGVVFWLLGIQGALLWGVVMGFMSLIPAIGTGVVWVPVAIYLFATGQIWQGAVLVGCGILVIGMVDNVLRPILVGKDTRMPDYVVLISTLGGLSVMGIHGFVTGPVIAALFIAAWDIFAAEKEERLLIGAEAD
jgi:predicted PurR-regulated permease PerM